jgi:EAL and modified HD-GYP domain-containing signal transduction protein
MDVFLARQPIFNRNRHVVAYEILYRSGAKNTYDIDMDGDKATTSVVIDALINFGIKKLTGGKMAYINFTGRLLYDDLHTLFETDILAIEILETQEVDDAFIEKCKEMKARGYVIALDDFIGGNKFDRIMPYVDVIKVDFLALESFERKEIADKYAPFGIKLLAEKVESQEDFDEAKRYGYHLFQGYFFEKPVMCKTKSINVSTYRYMEILKETTGEVPDFNRLAEIIKKDFSLTYKLLRLINSPAFYTVNEITSVNHALTLLGINEIKKWTTLIMLRDISSDKPDELIRVSLVRAIFAEKLAKKFMLSGRETEAFLLGLFSLIDTILEKPLFDIVEPLPLKEDLKGALMGDHNRFHTILQFLQYYEMGNWDMILNTATLKDLDHKLLTDHYLESIDEANKLFIEM